MTTPADSKDLDAMFANDVKQVDDTACRPYQSEIASLLRLCEIGLAEGAIADTSNEACAALIVLVQQATQSNLSQAELADRIEALGSVAVGIAKKVLGLREIL
jgi:hypothetical protein